VKKFKTTVQFYEEDVEKIKKLASLLGEEMGGKVPQRVTVMIAVSKMLKNMEEGSNG